MAHFRWEGVDRAGGEGRAKLGNGIAAPVVASEGAINPADLPPIIIWCGWEGETDGRYIPTGHNGPLTVHPQRSSPVGGETQREWRASGVLGAESLLLGTGVSVPVLSQ